MGTELMELFGSWLWWIFGIGLVLLIGGMAARQAAAVFEAPFARKLGQASTDLGWRMVLAAVASYFLIWGLSSVFESIVSNVTNL